MKGLYWGICGLVAAAGCVESRTSEQLDGRGDTSGDTSPDLAGPGGEVEIRSFTTDFASITRGVDYRGRTVDGRATLSWETTGAGGIELLVDGVPVSLEGCSFPAGSTCARAGSLTVRPSARTTFTLRASGGGGACPESGCPEAGVTVDVRAPVGLTFSPEALVVAPGADLEVSYAVSGFESFAIGRVDFEGGARIVACEPETSAGPGAPCVATADTTVAGAIASEGVMRVLAVDRAFAVGVEATNGAADGLGDIAAGDFFVEIGVPVVIATFLALPEMALPGGEVVLSWEVFGAQAVSVSTGSTALTGITTCVGIGADGRGFCTLKVADNAPLGVVRVTLLAEQEGGALGESEVAIEVIGGPRVGAFAASLGALVPGQGVDLEWVAYGADQVRVQASPAVLDGVSDCTALGADGRGRCAVTVAAAGTGPVTLTLTASNQAVGPAATAALTVDVLPAPAVLAFTADDVTVEPGSTVSLAWETKEAVGILLSEGSGVIPPADLARCAGGHSGDAGSCELELPRGLSAGAELSFSLRAIGVTGARSGARPLTVTIGLRPEVVFTVSPALLPQGGGAVALSWVAPAAGRVLIVDDGGDDGSDGEPAVLVDTTTTLCGATRCAAVGDTLTVVVTRPTGFELRADNDFGVTVVTRSVGVEGAPVITAFTVGGRDALAGPVLVDGESATVAWAALNLDASDLIRLERANSPGPELGCEGVSAQGWAAVAGFPKAGAASGSESVSVFSTTALCLRLVAEDLDASPSQRDVAVVKAYRAPAVTTLAVDDATVKTGDRVTLSWATTFAYRVALSVSPVGAVTSQELAGCTAASGSCAVTIQPGTPLGEVVFALVAQGESGSTSAPMTSPVTVGVGPSIGVFSASPGSVSTATDVTLSWTSQLGAALTVHDGAAEVFRTTTRAAMDAGSHVVAGVSTSRTWTLTVENAFGAVSAEARTFVGPSIDALTANGGNALDGNETVVTGPVTVSWSTTSADGSHRLEVANVPGNGNCGSATGWSTVLLRDNAPTPSASHSLGVVTQNRCVRLTVANAQTPPQTSAATFLLREVPEVVSLQTSPRSIASGGGTVIVTMGVRGASALGLTAQYRNAAGDVLGTRDVCDQGRLNSGSLTGGATVDTVECAHTVTPCNLLCLNNGMPSGTTRIRYLLSVSDGEGDGATASSATAQDVTVQ